MYKIVSNILLKMIFLFKPKIDQIVAKTRSFNRNEKDHITWYTKTIVWDKEPGRIPTILLNAEPRLMLEDNNT